MSPLDLFDATPLRPEPQSPAIGMIVRLDRDIDRQRPCHDNVVIIQPGKAPHAAELRCATCSAHRGWAPKAMLDFVTETTKRFGVSQTISWRQETSLDVAPRQRLGTAP
jgi:hypothetical protein